MLKSDVFVLSSAPLGVFYWSRITFSAFDPVQRPKTLLLVVNTQKTVAVKNE